MMTYCKSYKQWLQNEPSSSISVIEEFRLALILSMRKQSESNENVDKNEAEMLV